MSVINRHGAITFFAENTRSAGDAERAEKIYTN